LFLNNTGNRFLLILILLICISLSSSAQYFMVGPKAGVQAYNVVYQSQVDKDLYDTNYKFGYNVGIEMNIPLIKSFNLNPEINYTQRGRKITVKENGWTLNETHHYLEFPLILNYQNEVTIKNIGPFKNIGTITWFIGAGPNLSYLLGGSGQLETVSLITDYKISFGGHESDYHYMTFHDVNRWQWGLDFNAGFISPLKNGKSLVTTFRFTYGHTELGAENGSSMPILGFTDNLAHSYRVFNLSFAYLFGIDMGLFRKGKSTKGQKIKTKKVGGPSSKPKNINKFKKNKN